MNIGSYLSDLASRLTVTGGSVGNSSVSGEPNSSFPAFNQTVTFFDVQVIKFPIRATYALIGFVDGYQVVQLHESHRSVVCCQKTADPVGLLALLPPVRVSAGKDGKSGLCMQVRNLVVVLKGSASVVRFIDMTNEDTYHMVRLTGSAVGIRVSRSALAILLEGSRISVYDVETLQETFSVPVMPQSSGLAVMALGDRWLAYNLPPMHAMGGGDAKFSSSGGLLQTLSCLGQDAIDNIVFATMKSEVGVSASVVAPGSQSLTASARNGIIAIRDVVSQEIISSVEDCSNVGKPVEWLEWSYCGTMLVSAVGNGHCLNVYKCGLRKSGNATSKVPFEHIYSLSRGLTPAVITKVSVSPSAAQIAVSSGKGTVHIFDLLSGSREETAAVTDAATDTAPAVISASERLKTTFVGQTNSVPGPVHSLLPFGVFDHAGDLVVFAAGSQCSVQKHRNGTSGDSWKLTETDLQPLLMTGPSVSVLSSTLLSTSAELNPCDTSKDLLKKSPLIEWIDRSAPEQEIPLLLDRNKLMKALATDLLAIALNGIHDVTNHSAKFVSKEGFVQVLRE